MAEVLIVEDDVEILESLAEILRDEGYPVATARNGAEALARLRECDAPCLILLDLMMPVMNGWTFRETQLRDPKLAATPVVILSGTSDVDRHAVSLQAAGFIRKPIQLERLFELVEQHCTPLARPLTA
jgi:CheY-like chemotaxis protein